MSERPAAPPLSRFSHFPPGPRAGDALVGNNFTALSAAAPLALPTLERLLTALTCAAGRFTELEKSLRVASFVADASGDFVADDASGDFVADADDFAVSKEE